MKRTPEEIVKIREGLRDWQRPCEYGNCCYKGENDLCTKWSCIPEDEKIAQVLEQWA